MTRSLTLLFLSSIPLLLEFSACKESTVGPSPEPAAGDRTMIISAAAYDEFMRRVDLSGPISVTLISSDRTWRKTIPDGNSSCTFVGLPPQAYIIRGEREGYYPYETTAGDQNGGSNWSAWINLYKLPPPSMRIDSIRCYEDSYSRSVVIQLFSGLATPPNTYRNAVVFVGNSPNVSPKPGTYTQTFMAFQSGGSKELDLSAGAAQFGVPTGTRVYVTARFTTGGTKSFLDPSTSLQIWTYLEENSHAVASFVLQ